MEDFNSSLSFDRALYREDITGSMAHVKMLAKCNILSSEERDSILNGLQSILSDIETGKLKIEGDYEDIHSFVESNLLDRIGQVAKSFIPPEAEMIRLLWILDYMPKIKQRKL